MQLGIPPIILGSRVGDSGPRGRICLASLRHICNCRGVKVLQVPAICDGLVSLLSINLNLIRVEFDCLKAVKLITKNGVELAEVSFFIDEVKFMTQALGDISFSQFQYYLNVLVHTLRKKAMDERVSFTLIFPYVLFFRKKKKQIEK